MKLILILIFLSFTSFAFNCESMKMSDVAKELLERQIAGYSYTDASTCMDDKKFKYIKPDYGYNSENGPKGIFIDAKSLKIISVESKKSGAFYQVKFSIKGKDGRTYDNETMAFMLNEGSHGCVSILAQPKNFVDNACLE